MLEINNFNCWYSKEKVVLNNINLKLNRGEIVALLGKNGAGKTTLLNSIVGLHKNWDGVIKLEGKVLSKDMNIENKKDRYYIGDKVELLEELTSMEFMNFIHHIYNKKLDKDRLNYYAKIFDFESYINEKIQKLSLGNKQKVALITGFLINAPLFILDEPLVGLDVMAIETFYKEAKNYVRQGNTMLFSTHIIDVINNIGDGVYILDKSTIEGPFKINKDSNLREMFFKVIEND